MTAYGRLRRNQWDDEDFHIVAAKEYDNCHAFHNRWKRNEGRCLLKRGKGVSALGMLAMLASNNAI